MRTVTTNCVILGTKTFTENDKLVFMYSEDLGKIKVIAKGAKKLLSKFTGHLETLNSVTAVLYKGPRNIILTEISIQKNYFKSVKSLEKIRNALKIAEITNKILYEEQKLQGLMALLIETLEIFTSTKKSALITLAYIIKLLDKAGFIGESKDFLKELKDKPLKEIEKITLKKDDKKQIERFITKTIHATL